MMLGRTGSWCVGTAMDTNVCNGEPPARLRDKYDEAYCLIVQM
jgi:hypothetical protein